MMAAEQNSKPTTTASWWLIAISLIGGILIAGRLHFKQWAHEIVQYRDGKENDALVLIVYESVYLLLRIFVGAYGSYAIFRDLIGPMFRQESVKHAKA
jgi:hypothetical protein